MAYKQLLIILSGGNGRRAAVKLNGDFGGDNPVKITIKEADNFPNGVLYLVNDKIAKIELYKYVSEYKVSVSSFNDITCVLVCGDEVLVGGSGKTPPIRVLLSRIDGYEKAGKQLEKSNKALKENERARTEPTALQTESTALQAEPATLRTEHKISRTELEDAQLASADARSETDTIEQSGYSSAERKDDGYSSKPQANERLTEKRNRAEQTTQDATEYHDARTTPENYVNTSQRHASAVDVLDKGVRYDGTNFYLAIKPQLDELFVRYPEEKALNVIVPNSKWVHVNAEDGYYVVGVLYDMSVPSYICYGIPSAYQKQPPKEIEDVCVWLPLKLDNRDGNGYWVIYQSAVDGKCVR